jgi:predicted XRE-type DNA-binding protein
MTRATITKGSGNVFLDLGFSEEKSAELILKSNLLHALQETIKGRGWKQVEAAAQLRIDQPKVSKLLTGQMAGFSIERLVHFLSLLGQDVEITVRKASRRRRQGNRADESIQDGQNIGIASPRKRGHSCSGQKTPEIFYTPRYLLYPGGSAPHGDHNVWRR